MKTEFTRMRIYVGAVLESEPKQKFPTILVHAPRYFGFYAHSAND